MYREVISIAGIVMAIESPRDFLLADRCYAFRVEDQAPDVTFRLLPEQGFDPSGMVCLRQASHRSFWQQGQTRFYVCYDRQNLTQLRWFTRSSPERPGLVEVHVIAGDIWERVNPLTFVELSEFMIRHDICILHSSLIACQGRGILFTAPSGTGKSTQAELWKQYRGAQILNGDRSMIRSRDGDTAYGSPYSGSSGIYRNESAPVTAIVVLRQAPFNRVRRMTTKEAYLSLLSELSLSPISRETVERQSQWLLSLLGRVPVFLLECLPDEGAVDTLYDVWKEL